MRVPATPPVGHVVAYEFLWASQAAAREDGAKVYPVVVLMARTLDTSVTLAYALGISHSPPQISDRAMPLPIKLQRWLGLDERQSWIYTDQLNVFAWPGPDLRPADYLSRRADAEGTCVISPLPADWFEAVKAHVLESRRLQRLSVQTRTS